jgi:hypothetical protein
MAEAREALLRRARFAYERGRVKRALVGAVPALVFGAAACAMGADARRIGLAFVLFAAATAALVVGGALARGVLPGFLAGAIPFVTASVAQSFGHMCLDGVCMAYCAPACAASGVVAGTLVTWMTLRARGGLLAWASAATLVVTCGTLGCRCLGTGSVMGLLAGVVIVTLPAVPRLYRDSRAS